MQKSEMWMVAPNLCKVCSDLVGDMKRNQVYNFVLASRLKYKSTTLLMVLIYSFSRERVRGLRFCSKRLISWKWSTNVL